jgi:hypothetical protein
MDGNAYYPLSMPTNTRNGANMWSQFSNDISKAQKIEVYSQDKKIGEFNPTKQSAKKVLGDGLCDPMD